MGWGKITAMKKRKKKEEKKGIGQKNQVLPQRNAFEKQKKSNRHIMLFVLSPGRGVYILKPGMNNAKKKHNRFSFLVSSSRNVVNILICFLFWPFAKKCTR